MAAKAQICQRQLQHGQGNQACAKRKSSIRRVQPFAARAEGANIGTPPASVNLRGADVPPSAGAPVWHAIAEVGQAQKFLAEGQYYDCHSLKGVEPGDKVDFNRVLATNTNDGEFVLGRPYVPGAKVRARVIEHYRDQKKLVFKFKPKKHYKKTHGHRQAMTRFQVERVIYGDQKSLDEEISESVPNASSENA